MEPGTFPMAAVDVLDCVANFGIRGDRFFGHKENFKGQITFFCFDTLKRMWDELAVPEGSRIVSSTRRNVLVSGVDLNSLIDSEFEIQGIRFFGTEECRPCYWMNSAICAGAEDWMKGRGGLRARILTDGPLRVRGNSLAEHF
jgi:MOSC domain-containing protein YiiM